MVLIIYKIIIMAVDALSWRFRETDKKREKEGEAKGEREMEGTEG